MSGLLLIAQLVEHARMMPGGVAYRQAETGETWSWKKLDECSRRLAGRLRAEFPAGAVVVLTGNNQPQLAAGFLAILRAGMAAFPVPPGPELAGLAARARAGAILGPGINFNGEIGEDGDWRSAALLLTSSGTTGRPKIVRRSAVSLNAVTKAICDAIGFGVDDHVLAMAPLHHSYGLEHGLLAPIAAGSSVTLCKSFDLSIAIAELRDRTTILPAVPFMIEGLANADFRGPLKRMKHVYSAGGPLPASVAAKFSERFGAGVGQIYGTTEIGSVTFSDPCSHWFNPQSVGRPMRGVDLKLIDGQITIRAGSMFDGYLDDPPATADGYYLTGDLGQVDENGNLVITGRIKLLIDVGGRKVNPLEVEEVMVQHPQVGACVVVPMPVAATVTRLKALVVPRSGGPAPRAEELREFARQRLSAYKLPRIFELRDSLPLSATGKVLRELVKE